MSTAMISARTQLMMGWSLIDDIQREHWTLIFGHEKRISSSAPDPEIPHLEDDHIGKANRLEANPTAEQLVHSKFFLFRTVMSL